MTSPTVNRWVHYVTPGSADGRFPSTCRAAMVTEVGFAEKGAQVEKVVGLFVVNPTGFHFRPLSEGGAVYDDAEHPAPYTWHWPERA